MSPTNIPDGFELLSGRGRDNAKSAIATAEERGFGSSSVRTVIDGYLIPLPEGETLVPGEGLVPGEPAGQDESGERVEETAKVEAPAANATKGEIEDFAKTHGIDISGDSNNEKRLATINAELDRRAAADDASDETSGEPAGQDESGEPGDENKGD